MANNRARSRRKVCPFTSGKLQETLIDYKNLRFLRKYVSESWRIVSSRITGLRNKYQHRIAREIAYARFLALIPYCDRH